MWNSFRIIYFIRERQQQQLDHYQKFESFKSKAEIKMNRSDSIRRDRSYDSVLNRLMRITRTQNDSFKAAMYNFLIAAGIGAFIAVCFIIGPFVRQLL